MLPLRDTDPREVAGYRLLGRLGEGGQGVVFLAVGPDGGRVAVKLLPPTTDPQVRSRFLKEVAAAQRVARFCTAQVVDAGIFERRPFIVSEYVSGPSLVEVVEQFGPRTDAALERIAVATLTALGAVHATGMVHRDFKPGNVLLGPDGPVVIDFGLAAVPGMTTGLSGQVSMGTPAFMSPEQLAGSQVTAAADMWSWAATMVFAGTGELPFRGESLTATAFAILHSEPKLGTLPEPLSSMVHRCLSKDPADRPTARSALSELVAAGARPTGSMLPIASATAPRRPAGAGDADILHVESPAEVGRLGGERVAIRSSDADVQVIFPLTNTGQQTATANASLPAQPSVPTTPVVRNRRRWWLGWWFLRSAESFEDANEKARPDAPNRSDVLPDDEVSGAVNPDCINTRVEFFEALDAVRRRAELSPREVATAAGMQLRTVRGYFDRHHLPRERDVLRQVLVVCGVPCDDLPRWEVAHGRARSQRQQRAAKAKKNPQAAGPEIGDGPDLLFRVYIPKTRLYAEQQREILRLFKEWLTNVHGQGVRQQEFSTANGDTVAFFGVPGSPHPPLVKEYREFASFVEHCAHHPGTAVNRLAEAGICESAGAELVSRYAKEYHRLELDLRQARETRILTLQHTLEAELLERDTDPRQVTTMQIRSVLDHLVPGPEAALPSISASDIAPRPAQVSVTINLADQIEYTAVESIQGTANFGSQAREILALIERYGGQNASPLRTALHELEDPGIPHKLRSDAKTKLKSFLADLARRLPDVGIDLLEKYLEKRMGLPGT